MPLDPADSRPAVAARRSFLKAASAVAAATIVPRHVLGGPKHVAPSDRVNVALVGAGGRGLQNASELMKLSDVRVVAVADPAEHWNMTPEPTIPRSSGHHRDWIDAIKGGPPASSEFQYGAKLTEIALLGLLALRTGKIIRWDGESMSASGVPEANTIIHERYRDGWSIDA